MNSRPEVHEYSFQLFDLNSLPFFAEPVLLPSLGSRLSFRMSGMELHIHFYFRSRISISYLFDRIHFRFSFFTVTTDGTSLEYCSLFFNFLLFVFVARSHGVLLRILIPLHILLRAGNWFSHLTGRWSKLLSDVPLSRFRFRSADFFLMSPFVIQVTCGKYLCSSHFR